MKFVLTLLLSTLYLFSYCQTELNVVSQEEIMEMEKNAFHFSLDIQKIRSDLSAAPRYTEEGKTWIPMRIPFADGVYREVEVAEAPVVAPKIYNRYPENRSYKLRGVTDKYISGRLSITNRGMSAMIYFKDQNVFIEPVKGDEHKAYNFDSSQFENFACGTDHSNFKNPKLSTSRTSFGATERKYIIAIASTGEFSAKHGNNLSTINGIITDYLTELNLIYERDLAVTFELTADNDDIIFFDPNTDGLNPTNNSTKLSTSQSVINGAIGSANYDIGHTFYEMNPPSSGWWSSGVAGLGVVCSSSSKARGWTGAGGPYPTSFWMGTFAHEVGHQFNATHTFYGTAGNCGGSQRSVGNGVEPGSGNSLMSYEGSCGAGGACTNQNITPESSFLYFHSHSVNQINTFVNGSGSCYTSSSSGNSPPNITMPSAETIPGQTPFFLSATVTDPDGDPLLISWEEVDTDNLSLSCPNGAPNDAATSTTAPLFRSFDPSADGNIRYFPQLSDILDDIQTMGEILPEVDRDIDMRCIARGTSANGISGVDFEDVTITVDGDSGPFEVTTAPNPIAYSSGQSVTIQWLVNNTNLAPVSCANVNILFSFDGGNTFPLTLASNVTNDGSHPVTMPGNGTTTGRIKVEAADNIFFSINKGDITINSTCVTNSTTILNADDVTADPGDPSLNLELTIGDEVSSVSGTISSSDPSSTLIADDGNSASCIDVPTNPYYDTYLLVANGTDTYTFTKSGTFNEVMNIYDDEYIVPLVNCMNWLSSNATYTPPSINIAGSTSVSLNDGDIIELVVSPLYTGVTGTYTVTFSSAGSGELANTDIVPLGFVYKFVIYNASGNIMAIEDEADLSDSNIYTSDIYTVKGLLVSDAVNLAPYVNGPFSTLESDVFAGTVCGEFSTNDVTVTVNGCTPGTKTVTSTLDNGGTGTLRYLIENACGGDVIVFHPALLNSTLTLNSEITLDKNITITGLGKNNLTLSGGNNNRIFNISSGTSVTVSDLALKNGYAASNGGAFLNNGNLAIGNLLFEGNMNGATSKAFTNAGTINFENSVDILD